MKVYAVSPAFGEHEKIEALFSTQEKAEEYARTFGIRMYVIAWELDNPEADRVFFSAHSPMRAVPGIINGMTVAGTCPSRGNLDEIQDQGGLK